MPETPPTFVRYERGASDFFALGRRDVSHGVGQLEPAALLAGERERGILLAAS
jgi:hypothetical protein